MAQVIDLVEAGVSDAFLESAAGLIAGQVTSPPAKRELFIDNLLVRIYLIVEMIWWTGLAPWQLEFPFPDSLTSTFLKTQTPSILCSGLQTHLLRKPQVTNT